MAPLNIAADADTVHLITNSTSAGILILIQPCKHRLLLHTGFNEYFVTGQDVCVCVCGTYLLLASHLVLNDSNDIALRHLQKHASDLSCQVGLHVQYQRVQFLTYTAIMESANTTAITGSASLATTRHDQVYAHHSCVHVVKPGDRVVGSALPTKSLAWWMQSTCKRAMHYPHSLPP